MSHELTNEELASRLQACLRNAASYEHVECSAALVAEAVKRLQKESELGTALASATIALVTSLRSLGWSTEKINSNDLIVHLGEVLAEVVTDQKAGK